MVIALVCLQKQRRALYDLHCSSSPSSSRMLPERSSFLRPTHIPCNRCVGRDAPISSSRCSVAVLFPTPRCKRETPSALRESMEISWHYGLTTECYALSHGLLGKRVACPCGAPHYIPYSHFVAQIGAHRKRHLCGSIPHTTFSCPHPNPSP
ncbi:hypothetical protein BHE74_00016294 [Ensete ventricosum]|nr:hypothetical protein BHE74_00016294 [Ensete ventricosum]RZR95787.1 hypothetical protein BHM03_00024660 [Ensete ventricosum]